MKNALFLLLLPLLLAQCTGTNSNTTGSNSNDSLAARIERVREAYRPDLGDIMLGIQLHHGKLWFAGINQNWKLAAFEANEIREQLHEAVAMEQDRPEIKTLPMIYPPLDSLLDAINSQNAAQFKSSFQVLTNTCNACHTVNHYEFNVITIPSAPPVTNQRFEK